MTQQPDDTPECGTGPADPGAVREFWLQTVRPAADRGRLETVPTVKGTSKRGRDVARTQNYHLTRRTFGMPDGYDRIKWNHDLKGKTA